MNRASSTGKIILTWAGSSMIVVRNELCPQEYYAYTTEGKEKVKVQEYAEQYGSYEKGISQLVRDLGLTRE